MLKDINSVKLSGSIFWNKLDDRQSFSMLRLGIKLEDGNTVFATINNPNTKAYDLVKPGNKIVLINAWLDTWKRKDGTEEVQIKTYDSHSQFFPKEASLPNINNVTLLGTIVAIDGEFATLKIRGDRNPKTGKHTERSVKVEIGKYAEESIKNRKVFIEAKLTSVLLEGGKTQMQIETNYDKIIIL